MSEANVQHQTSGASSVPQEVASHQDSMVQDSWAHPQGHMMAHNDPENPQNFPLHRKLYTSLVASAFTFTLLFAATSYTAALPQIVETFGVSQVKAVLGQSVFIFGVIPAPLVTPHISERVGRNAVYFTSLLVMSLFIVGASQSQSFGAIVACRFFAGLFGGPIAVNIEGTYADIWPAMFTGSYYTFVTSSQYFGAATGAILGGNFVFTQDWRWTQYITLMIAAGTFLLAIGVPETYPREIIRRRERKAGVASSLMPAASGTTVGEMAHLTLIQPFMMLFTDPVTALIALYMAMNFGITFQWFVSVPATLTMLAKFNARQDGLAFVSAIGGTVLAAISTLIIDQIGARRARSKPMSTGQLPAVEHRLVSAIMGSILLAAAVFWVANTAAPAFSFYIPIVGTGIFVWGSAMCLTGFIGYLFDVYTPQAILSSLSVVAYSRLVTAGWLPLVIIPLTNNLTPKWGLNLLGFFAAVFISIPVFLYAFGAKLRAKSRYHNKGDGMSPAMMETQSEGEKAEKPEM